MAEILTLAAHMQARRAAGKRAFIPFLTAGYPDADTFRRLLLACGAADCLEVGLPFSDPVADGPSICRASDVALAGGMHAAALFDLLETLPALPPLVVMTYLNPLLAFGVEAFMRRAAAARVRGLIVTDLPVEDGTEIFAAAAAHDIATILLVAPTTSAARMRHIAARATGFLYCVAVTGTTGARDQLGAQAEATVRKLRAVSALPVVVGFGIATPAQARAVCRFADGVVVGSALVDLIRTHTDAASLPERFRTHVDAFAAAARDL